MPAEANRQFLSAPIESDAARLGKRLARLARSGLR